MLKTIQSCILKRELANPGDRVGVAVSGGADSVALLLALVEVGEEMGLQLSVVHFNHRIRGKESDSDERFVSALAERLGLQSHCASDDAPARARSKKESLETAARNLRYGFFERLVQSGAVDKIATAHTMDDQAETVLMRFLRGAGTRGTGGIHPAIKGKIIRPMLEVRREEVERFLKARQQEWRDDATNKDERHSRNWIRQKAIPVLREFNPAITETLARSAEIARAEEDFWQAEVERHLPGILLPGKATRGGGRTAGGQEKSCGLEMDALKRQPVAMQRRIVRAAAESLGVVLDQAHVEEALKVVRAQIKGCEWPNGYHLKRSFRELRIESGGKEDPAANEAYQYPLPIPGEVQIPEVNLLIRAYLKAINRNEQGYNRGAQKQGELSSTGVAELLAGEGSSLKPITSIDGGFCVRNWHAGDRFLAANSKGETMVKEVLQDLKIPQAERKLWPLITAGEKVVWLYGARNQELWLNRDGQISRLVIEEKTLG